MGWWSGRNESLRGRRESGRGKERERGSWGRGYCGKHKGGWWRGKKREFNGKEKGKGEARGGGGVLEAGKG